MSNLPDNQSENIGTNKSNDPPCSTVDTQSLSYKYANNAEFRKFIKDLMRSDIEEYNRAKDKFPKGKFVKSISDEKPKTSKIISKMSKFSDNRSISVDSNEFPKTKIPAAPKNSLGAAYSKNSEVRDFIDDLMSSDIEEFHRLKSLVGKSSFKEKPPIYGSLGDISNQVSRSSSGMSREGSLSSNITVFSRYPTFTRGSDHSSGFSISQSFVPRPEKTLVLFNHIITTLQALSKKYAMFTTNSGDRPQGPEGGQVCSLIDNRLLLLQCLRSEYQALMDDKQDDLKQIQSSISSNISNKSPWPDVNNMDCEIYWSHCREMCLTEMKLERCAGKLQFQIMELDSVSRVNPFDQFEITIRFNDNSKFKTKIKVERNGRQVWDNTTFVLNPTVDDLIHVKLKNLNKSIIVLDKKLPFVNNLILTDPSIYSLWLTPIGTIKLKVIVQWNAMLSDSELTESLRLIDNKYNQNGVVIRSRSNSAVTNNANNRLSQHFRSASQSSDNKISSISMEDIVESVEFEMTQNVNIRTTHLERSISKAKALYHGNEARDSMTANHNSLAKESESETDIKLLEADINIRSNCNDVEYFDQEESTVIDAENRSSAKEVNCDMKEVKDYSIVQLEGCLTNSCQPVIQEQTHAHNSFNENEPETMVEANLPTIGASVCVEKGVIENNTNTNATARLSSDIINLDDNISTVDGNDLPTVSKEITTIPPAQYASITFQSDQLPPCQEDNSSIDLDKCNNAINEIIPKQASLTRVEQLDTD